MRVIKQTQPFYFDNELNEYEKNGQSDGGVKGIIPVMKIDTKTDINKQNNPGNKVLMFQMEFLSKINPETEIGKEASIRDADEKEKFFNREMKNVMAKKVSRVESPNPDLGKIAIPNDEWNGRK